MATNWHLLNTLSTVTSAPTVYHESDGRCYTGSGSTGSQIDVIRVDVPDSAVTSVAIYFEPRTATVPVLDENDTTIIKVPSGHAGTATWSLAGSTTTITFDVPSSSVTEWGWEFINPNLPEPLHIKIRVKRP